MVELLPITHGPKVQFPVQEGRNKGMGAGGGGEIKEEEGLSHQKWKLTSVILALKRLGWEGVFESFEASLGYITKPRLKEGAG